MTFLKRNLLVSLSTTNSSGFQVFLDEQNLVSKKCFLCQLDLLHNYFFDLFLFYDFSPYTGEGEK